MRLENLHQQKDEPRVTERPYRVSTTTSCHGHAYWAPCQGKKYVLVVGDYFTKWVEAYTMPNMEAGTVAELFVSRFVC